VPGPILVLRPTVDEARRFSRQRLDPMIATTPVLNDLVREARSREGGNSLLIKEFPGGVLFLTGSNSATGVKSMPIRWLPWSATVAEFIPAKEDPLRLKNWVNSVLGETWEERGETVDPESLLGRAERYPAEVPSGVGVLVASVDVQGDRLECAVKGFGVAEESWLIAFSQFHGDPGRDKVWHELDQFLGQMFTHESGQQVPISCVTVDSGGHHSEQVYRFCRARIDRRVFAIRGGSEKGKPVVGRPTTNNRYRAKLFTLCVDTAKEIVFSRLRIGTAGPGYCHLPEWIDEEYIALLTAEKAIRKWIKNRGTVREWVKTRERNEALDLEVYCLAALYILGPTFVKSLPERAAALDCKREAPVADEPASGPALQRRRGWVDGWRG